MDWLAEHYIEIFGAVTGLLFLYLEIKENIWLWPVGIVTSALYIYIFFFTKFYADMSLQFYYLGVSIYGWWRWVRGEREDNSSEGLPVIRLQARLGINLLIFTVAVFLLMMYVLINFTDSPVPIGDAFTTALSITATWMLTRKILDMWFLWMVANGVSLGLYIYKGLYPTSVLFFFYFAMSIVGYLQWKKSYNLSLTQPDEITEKQ